MLLSLLRKKKDYNDENKELPFNVVFDTEAEDVVIQSDSTESDYSATTIQYLIGVK